MSDTQNPPIIAAECLKIFDVQCVSGRVFESLEKILVFKPFSTYVPPLYSLETENIWFSDVVRGNRSGTLVENGLSIRRLYFI